MCCGWANGGSWPLLRLEQWICLCPQWPPVPTGRVLFLSGRPVDLKRMPGNQENAEGAPCKHRWPAELTTVEGRGKGHGDVQGALEHVADVVCGDR